MAAKPRTKTEGAHKIYNARVGEFAAVDQRVKIESSAIGNLWRLFHIPNLDDTVTVLLDEIDVYCIFDYRHVYPRQADPDHTTGKGDTPAILAAAGGHLCAIAELEEAGADLDRGNYAGETPLIVASQQGETELVAFLTGLIGTDLNR